MKLKRLRAGMLAVALFVGSGVVIVTDSPADAALSGGEYLDCSYSGWAGVAGAYGTAGFDDKMAIAWYYYGADGNWHYWYLSGAYNLMLYGMPTFWANPGPGYYIAAVAVEWDNVYQRWEDSRLVYGPGGQGYYCAT